MATGARVFVAGHRGLVGSALVRRLHRNHSVDVQTATREQLDLRDQAAVNYWFKANRPEYVYLVAGTVGGILANSTRPAEFIYDNMMIHATVVQAAHLYHVKKLLYLGSSCIYPRDCEQPMTEEQLRPARSSRPTSQCDCQDRRYQALSGVARSTATTSSRRCRRTSTAPKTISISPRRTCSRR
jgi:nucleoside-diphosphate-sugar epimerase